MPKSKKKQVQETVRTHEMTQPEAGAENTAQSSGQQLVESSPNVESGEQAAVSATPVRQAEPVGEPFKIGPTPRSVINSISIEAGLYLLLFMAALASRFSDLGSRPLAGNEAAVAIAAWQFLQGHGTAFMGPPFLFSTNLLLFFLGGPTDATVRLVPALVGSLLVLLPALMRRELGRTGAVIASFVLLFSPTCLFFARDSSGVEISVAAGLVAAIFLWRYFEGGSARLLYLGSVTAAAALTASSAGVFMLAGGLVSALVLRWLFGRFEMEYTPEEAEVPDAGDDPAPPGPLSRRSEWRNALLLFAESFLVIATALTTNRAGLAGSFATLTEWAAGFQRPGPFYSPINLLPVYEPLSLVFGFAGLILLPTLRGRGMRTRGLLLFSGFLLLLGIISCSVSGDKSPANVLILVVPLAILAGWFIGSLFERTCQDIANAGGWRVIPLGELPVIAMALALAALVYVELASLLQQNRFSPSIETLRLLISQGAAPGEFDTALLLLALFALAVAAFVVFLAITLIGTTRASNLAALIVGLLLVLSSTHSLWLANFSGSDTTNELIAGEQTSLQARDLVHDLEWLSQWRDGDPHVIPLQADLSLGPVVQWYLRAFKSVQWGNQPQTDVNAEAILTGGNAPAPTGPWIYQSYRIQVDWQPQNLVGEALWNWLLFRDGGRGTWQYVKLYAPTPE
jgi:uncharacterized protein (TIGR03663 family)